MIGHLNQESRAIPARFGHHTDHVVMDIVALAQDRFVVGEVLVVQ